MSREARFRAAPAIPRQVADHLQERIVRGELRPGERIAEARVTEALGVSRGSVREALHLLHARHMVDYEPRRGARVAPFGPDDVNGLYDVHIALLTLLVQKIAQQWNDEELARFGQMQAGIVEAASAGETLGLLALVQDFERAAAALLGNPYLSETLERLMPAFSRAHYRVLARGRAERMGLADFLDDLLAAAAARDAEGLRRAVRRYGEQQRALVLATFDEPPGGHATQAKA